MKKLIIMVLIASMLLVPTCSLASNYPEKPVTLVIPQAAGGSLDLAARAFTSVAQKYFGKPVVIKIHAGGGTVLGTQDVIRANADGYTLLYGANHLFALKYLRGKIPFDPAVELKPIALLLDMPWVLCVAKDAPWNTFEEFLKHVKANPEKVTMANASAMSVPQVPALQIEQYTGAKFIHVPYDGGGPANQSVVQGDSVAVFATTGWAVSAIRDGLVKGLAITGKNRFKLLPSVPTLNEFNVPCNVTLWAAIYGPKDLPNDIVDKLNEYIVKVNNDPQYIKMQETLGNVPQYENSEKFAERIADEEKALSSLVKSLNIKIEQ